MKTQQPNVFEQVANAIAENRRNEFVLDVIVELSHERHARGQEASLLSIARDLGLLIEPAISPQHANTALVLDKSNPQVMFHLDVVPPAVRHSYDDHTDGCSRSCVKLTRGSDVLEKLS